MTGPGVLPVKSVFLRFKMFYAFSVERPDSVSACLLISGVLKCSKRSKATNQEDSLNTSKKLNLRKSNDGQGQLA